MKVGSIESHHVGTFGAWKIVVKNNCQVTNRCLSAVAEIDDRAIAVFGGLRKLETLKDGYVL